MGVSQIKYFDYNPLPGSGSKMSTNCSPRGSVSCRPVTRTDCVKVSYTDCSMNAGGDGECKKQDKFVHSQEKVHQKKCLDADETNTRARRSINDATSEISTDTISEISTDTKSDISTDDISTREKRSSNSIFGSDCYLKGNLHGLKRLRDWNAVSGNKHCGY